MFFVLAIYVCTEKGGPMQSAMSAMAVTGHGLDGDRYATSKGSYSKSKVGKRDVTLISKEGLDAANQHSAVETPFHPEETRRNIVVSGGPENLCDLKDRRIVIGDGVVLKFTEECDPCMRPSNLSGKPGFKEAFADNGRGGIRTAVIEGGEIKVGDKIVIDGNV